MKSRKPTGGFCAETCPNNGHGSWQSLSAWVSAQPAPTCHCFSFLSLPSLPSPSSPSSPFSFPPLYFSILRLQLFQLPPPHHLSFSRQDLQATVPPLQHAFPSIPMRHLPPQPPLPLCSPSFSLRGCSSHCTLTAWGYCVWKCSCWTHRPLQSIVQRLEHLCLRLGTFDLQLTLQTCQRG